MTVACDERSPERGCDKEEPKEPPAPPSSVNCKRRIRVVNGIRVLGFIESEIKEPFYHYNSLIAKYGYMLKPVHRVYKKKYHKDNPLAPPKILIYSYYGRYWWKRVGKKFVYAGTVKPSIIPFEPPENKLAGKSIVIDFDDIIIDCETYEMFKKYMKGYKILNEY